MPPFLAWKAAVIFGLLPCGDSPILIFLVFVRVIDHQVLVLMHKVSPKIVTADNKGLSTIAQR
jgi:hypothetical protein